jgi:phosphatidylglycerophosphate synthase
MNHSLRSIRAAQNPEKLATDGFMTRFVYRPLAYPSSWLFLRLGLRPNQVTYASAMVCLAGFICALIPSPFFHLYALLAFLVFAVLDCADGTMARAIGAKTTFGGFVDAAGGYLAYTVEISAMGFFCLYLYPDGEAGLPLGLIARLPWGGASWVILSMTSASANILMRLFFQAHKNAEIEGGMARGTGISGEKRLSEEIGVTGFLPVLIALGYYCGLLPPVLFLYSAVYVGGFLLSSVRLFSKIERCTGKTNQGIIG